MYLRNSKTVVIKIGSSLLIDDKSVIRKRWLEEFSKDIQELKSENKNVIIVSSVAIALGCKKLNFIIGSEEWLDSFFKDSFLTISFGNQTWPHLLIRVMLIEQIYRGLEIIKNSRYHK